MIADDIILTPEDEKAIEKLSSFLPDRFSALIASIRDVCTSRAPVLSGEKDASLERMK